METNDEIRKFITENVAHSESLRHHKDQIIATVHENSAGVFLYAGNHPCMHHASARLSVDIEPSPCP
jgi:hypothetical protein